jgi:hypothetical protein
MDSTMLSPIFFKSLFTAHIIEHLFTAHIMDIIGFFFFFLFHLEFHGNEGVAIVEGGTCSRASCHYYSQQVNT